MKKLVVVLVLTISCSGSEVDPTIQLEHNLLGEWEWLLTYGLGFSEEPATVGYTKRLNFLGNKIRVEKQIYEFILLIQIEETLLDHKIFMLPWTIDV